MAISTISPGLEIRRLAFKDDSFRQAEWFDNTTGNAITFNNGIVTTVGNFSPSVFGTATGSTTTSLTDTTKTWTTNVFVGYSLLYTSGPNAGLQETIISNTSDTVTTSAFPNTPDSSGDTYAIYVPSIPSPVMTNGDELTLPSGYIIQKDFGTEATVISVNPLNVGSIRLRAKNLGTTSTLTIVILQVGGNTNTFTQSITSSLYQHWTIPATEIDYDIIGIKLSCSPATVMIDYIGLATCQWINQGGDSQNITVPKKTNSQTIPNEADIIQQLGISSRSVAIEIPLVTIDTYNWLDNLLVNSIPIEIVSQTQQMTGYIGDLKEHSEAGWVGIPLPSGDSLDFTATPQQLYTMTLTVAKADNEQNIDNTAPVC